MSFMHSLELGDSTFPDELYDSDEAREAMLARAEGAMQGAFTDQYSGDAEDPDSVFGTEQEQPDPVTLMDCAKARGAIQVDGGYNLAEFIRTGIQMFGGCEVCGASIAAYNACPSKSGFIRCASSCIGEDGFATTAEFEEWSEQNATVEEDY